MWLLNKWTNFGTLLKKVFYLCVIPFKVIAIGRYILLYVSLVCFEAVTNCFVRVL